MARKQETQDETENPQDETAAAPPALDADAAKAQANIDAAHESDAPADHQAIRARGERVGRALTIADQNRIRLLKKNVRMTKEALNSFMLLARGQAGAEDAADFRAFLDDVTNTAVGEIEDAALERLDLAEGEAAA